MQELKATKVKEKNSLEVELLATLVAHPLPLADFFAFDFSFLILPDIISDNMPVPFLQSILSSLLVFIQFLYILPIKLYKIINHLFYYTKVFS